MGEVEQSWIYVTLNNDQTSNQGLQTVVNVF